MKPPTNGSTRQMIYMMDYEALLKRAKDNLPEYLIEHSRFVLPDDDVVFEGNTTVLRNFRQFVNAIHRKEESLISHMQRELGTAGTIDGPRALFKGRLSVKKIRASIDSFISTYVLCAECGKPDTHFMREGRIQTLKCDACGAHRTVRKSSKGPKNPSKSIPAIGDVIEVNITHIGKKGDGMGKIGEYLVIVPGALKGDAKKVKIDRVSGKIIQTHMVP